MDLLGILESIFIGPLKLVFEMIYSVADEIIENPGLSIIVLSLTMNILVLPLYRRADAMQEEARKKEAQLHHGIQHIKKTFTGDERMMILQTYYRQNHYSPLSALNGSVSLLLEIPFFMAAYQFLSNVNTLGGVSFGPIMDLSAPDGLLVIGGITLNLLPILMTTINVVSSYIYLKGFPLKTKIQLYGMAAFFLIFLYDSPSCLVFYWTLNNLFSLVKTIFYKIKNPKKVLSVLGSLLGIVLILSAFFVFVNTTIKVKILLIGLGFGLQYPVLYPLIKDRLPKVDVHWQANPTVFLLGSIFLTLLVGLLIPSVFISASPQEYVDITYFHDPSLYIINSLALAFGTFMVWFRVFYWLANEKGKAIFDKGICVLSVAMLINYMFFGTNLGVISATLQYDNALIFSLQEQLVNIGVLLLVGVVVVFITDIFRKVLPYVLLTAIIAISSMSIMNMVTIRHSIHEIVALQESEGIEMPTLELSDSSKNVVVMMLDSAIGPYVPYMMKENATLKEQFDGFTQYSNTISYGGHTNFGVPAMLGGYEYTPVEMNKRDDELLVDKHNEAIKVLPALFYEHGYDVTICDPVYVNYKWISGFDIFDAYPNMKTNRLEGRFSDEISKKTQITNTNRNFFVFSLMKTMPLTIQPILYGGGGYHQAATYTNETVYTTQVCHGLYKATGISESFMKAYNVLENLPNMTKITENGANTYLFMSNNATHEPMLMQVPGYIPSEEVDNTEYYAKLEKDFYTIDGHTLRLDNVLQMSHYQTNMAVLMKLGEWFDYLRENGVYDNTRIILVADHGRGYTHFSEFRVEEEGISKSLEYYFPLLMVKDFGSHGFTINDDFMTNADVPTLAVANLIENPTNPFTGKAIHSEEKTKHEQLVILSDEWQVTKNNGYTYLPSKWASVKNGKWDMDNWEFETDEVVLKEHKLPKNR